MNDTTTASTEAAGDENQPPRRLHRTISMPFGDIHAPSGWEELPPSALATVFGLLAPRDLAAAACACRAWHAEAARDERWRRHWRETVGEQHLWRWASAGGGYREQLRARSAVKRGRCSATVFPLARGDGPVVEVLMRDTGGLQRIVTAQARLSRPGSTRLHGVTVKVWNAAALAAQRPLVVVHDCVKHIQLEDGRLLLWRVAHDALIRTKSLDPSDEEAVAEAAVWAQHPDIVPSLLDPAALTLTDIPLESRFGHGATPFEWMDFFAGCVGSVALVSAPTRRVRACLYDVDTGALLRQSECPLPELEAAPDWGDAEVSCIMSRSADATAPVLVAAVLFDVRTFMWRLPPAPFPGQSLLAQQQHQQLAQQQRQHQQGQQPAAAAAAPGAGAAAEGAAGEWPHEICPMFTTRDEPVVDISVSTAAQRVFVLGMENLFVLGLDGRPLMVINMPQWKGVPVDEELGTPDLGAFSWPLPCSTKTAFYLDSCSSLFVAEFRRPQIADYQLMHTAAAQAEDARQVQFDLQLPLNPQGAVVNQPIFLQVHTDLRPMLPGGASILAGRGAHKMKGSQQEPVIVEYSQEGSVVYTIADSSCPAVAKLLRLEREGGTYLAGLGPARAREGRRVVEGGSGGGKRAPLAPRAVVCIDSATGRRFKALPIEGVVEAIHSTGQYLVVAVAGSDSYPEGPRGSLVVVDFTSQPDGFGGQQAQQGEQQERRQRAQRGRRKGSRSAAAAADVEAGEAAEPAGTGGEEDGAGEGPGPSRAARGRRSGSRRSSERAAGGGGKASKRQGKRGNAEGGEGSSSAAAGKKRSKRK